METIKEKDLTQQSTLSWIRGLDAAGNPIRINASDLAELIRTNMSIASNSKKGLIQHDIMPTASYNGDLDEIAQTSIMRISGNSINIPEGEAGSGSMVMTMIWDQNAVHQLFFGFSGIGNGVYYRRKRGGVYSAWLKFYFN